MSKAEVVEVEGVAFEVMEGPPEAENEKLRIKKAIYGMCGRLGVGQRFEVDYKGQGLLYQDVVNQVNKAIRESETPLNLKYKAIERGTGKIVIWREPGGGVDGMPPVAL